MKDLHYQLELHSSSTLSEQSKSADEAFPHLISSKAIPFKNGNYTLKKHDYDIFVNLVSKMRCYYVLLVACRRDRETCQLWHRFIISIFQIDFPAYITKLTLQKKLQQLKLLLLFS